MSQHSPAEVQDVRYTPRVETPHWQCKHLKLDLRCETSMASYNTPPAHFATSPPPVPPPKPGNNTQPQAPPRPPLPNHNGPSELDGSDPNAYTNSQSTPQLPPQPGPYPPAYDTNNSNNHYNQPVQSQQPQPLHSVPPIEPGWLPPNLEEKSTADLQHLLATQDLQTALLQNPTTTHPSLPLSREPLQTLLQENTSLASQLQVLEDTLRQRREETQTRLLSLKALEQQHRAKMNETERELQRFSPMALYERLRESVGEQEAVVAELEREWLEVEGVATSGEVEGWVRRVKEARKVGFLRRERKARWDEGRVGGWR